MTNRHRSLVLWLVAGSLIGSLSTHAQTVDMSATTDSSSGTNPSTLISIDVADGTQTPVGMSGAAVGTRNIDYDRVSGSLIGTDIFNQPGILYEVDTSSGVSTPVALLQDGGAVLPVGAVAYAPNGDLFAIAGFSTGTEHELGTVDLASQTFMPVLSFPAGRLYVGMDFAPDGLLYAVHTSFPQQTLSVIDVSVPAIVSETPIDTLAVGDLDFAPDGFIYHSNFSLALARMDPQTGAQTIVGFGSLGAPAGLASRPGPLPSAGAGFIGEISLVEVDTGSSQFSGNGIGSVYSGVFNYGNSEVFAAEIFSETNERDFRFLGEPFRSTLFDGSSSVASLDVSVNHQDDVAIDEDEASLLSLLLGQTVTAGTIIDTWSVAALSTGAYEEDPDPNDQDDEELLFNGVLFDLVFVDLDAELSDGLVYRADAPGMDEADLVLFTVNEADAGGQLLYSALGVVSSLVDDTDADGIGDASDNCLLIANGDQIDTNGDGFGNACDPDLNNDCVVNFTDLSQLRAVFLGNDPDADTNSDGLVNFIDLAVTKDFFLSTPGPSALTDVCEEAAR